MAKRKTVELKTKREKISDEHLEDLQHIVNSINSIQFNIGKVEIQKYELLNTLTKAQDKVRELQEKMLEQYGSYDINLKDGTINWPKDPIQNSVEKSDKDEK